MVIDADKLQELIEKERERLKGEMGLIEYKLLLIDNDIDRIDILCESHNLTGQLQTLVWMVDQINNVIQK